MDNNNSTVDPLSSGAPPNIQRTEIRKFNYISLAPKLTKVPHNVAIWRLDEGRGLEHVGNMLFGCIKLPLPGRTVREGRGNGFSSHLS